MGVLPAGIMGVQAEYLHTLVALSYDKPPGSVAGFEIIAHAHNMTKSKDKKPSDLLIGHLLSFFSLNFDRIVHDRTATLRSSMYSSWSKKTYSASAYIILK